MFVVCGEALFDVFAVDDTATGMALDARIGGSPFNVAVGLRRLGQPVAFMGEEVPLILPYDVPANQFMNLEGKKISGSRSWAVWGRDALTRFDPDAIRYYLTFNMAVRWTI